MGLEGHYSGEVDENGQAFGEETWKYQDTYKGTFRNNSIDGYCMLSLLNMINSLYFTGECTLSNGIVKIGEMQSNRWLGKHTRYL